MFAALVITSPVQAQVGQVGDLLLQIHENDGPIVLLVALAGVFIGRIAGRRRCDP